MCLKMKEKSKRKQIIPWLIIIPVVVLLLAGTLYFNQKAITLPLEYQNEKYELIYGYDFSLEYEREYGNGSARAISRVSAETYPNKIDREDVKQLLSSLEIRKINLRSFDKLLEPGESYVMAEEEDWKTFFEIRGKNWIETDGDVCLIVTEEGTIYVNGYRYTGDSTQFQEAFTDLVEQLTAEEVEDNGFEYHMDQKRKEEVKKRYQEDFRNGLKMIDWGA